METKRPYIRVCACRHVSAPDPPGEGCRFLPPGEGSLLFRGSGTPRGVRDFRGGPDSTGGPEPRLFGLSACLFRDTRCSWTFPSRETGPGPLSGEQDSGPQGSGCLDVVKDNYKALA